MLDIYFVSDRYVSYLYSHDNRVQFNKKQSRPYVGVVLFVGSYRYFVPMESPKPRHASMKSGPHFFKIEGGRLGLLDFNNMIPVPESALVLYDISAEPDADYRSLLQHQALSINNSQSVIMQKAAKTYYSVVNQKNKFLCSISCDFRKLELACSEYEKSRDE